MLGIGQRISLLRGKRWANLCVVNLRIMIGFAFLPAGLKKVLGQPFTDADKVGVFHEFLHAFLATGGFYHFVGAMQLIAAALLMTQRYATLGAALLLPIIVAINALCWSSTGVPTIVVVNLITLGTIALLLWDLQKWRAIFLDETQPISIQIPAIGALIDRKIWTGCGLAILVVYLAACGAYGGVYRPRGAEWNDPSFYLLPILALFPLIALGIDRHRRLQPS